MVRNSYLPVPYSQIILNESISLPAFSHDRMIIHRTIAVSIIKAYIISQVQCIGNPLFQDPSETIEQFISAKLLRSATGSGKIWMAATPYLRRPGTCSADPL